LSKERDSLNFSIIGSVPPLNRPPAPNKPPRAPVAVLKEKKNENGQNFEDRRHLFT
jgi:hypothetical protein